MQTIRRDREFGRIWIEYNMKDCSKLVGIYGTYVRTHNDALIVMVYDMLINEPKGLSASCRGLRLLDSSGQNFTTCVPMKEKKWWKTLLSLLFFGEKLLIKIVISATLQRLI